MTLSLKENIPKLKYRLIDVKLNIRCIHAREAEVMEWVIDDHLFIHILGMGWG